MALFFPVRDHRARRPQGKTRILVLFALLLCALSAAAQEHEGETDGQQQNAVIDSVYPSRPIPRHHGLVKRQEPGGNLTHIEASASSTTFSATTTTMTMTSAIISTSSAAIASSTSQVVQSSTSVPPRISTLTATATATVTQNATSAPEPSGPKGVDTSALAYGGAAVGGLVFVIGIAIVMFRCTLNRRERERRNKEMAATLAENFDRGGGDPIASPRKGYLELGEGPPTPNPGHIGANLSRQGSQDAYFAGKDGNTGGAQGGYSPHYVQERYGAANAGNYGMYEETELSVIGGNIGRPTTPYVDPSVGYAPSNNAAAGHYAGYNDYERGRYDGYYGGGGGQATTPRAPQGYQ